MVNRLVDQLCHSRHFPVHFRTHPPPKPPRVIKKANSRLSIGNNGLLSDVYMVKIFVLLVLLF
jgi:hypothetical protein